MLTSCTVPTVDFGGKLIAVTVSSAIVEVGDTVRVTAQGQLDGLLGLLYFDPVRDAKWAVADGIATLEPIPPPPPTDTTWTARTWVRGKQPGRTFVRARARGITGQGLLRVIPTLESLEIRGASDTLRVGDTITIAMMAVATNGQDVPELPIVLEPDTTGRLNPVTRDGPVVRLAGTSPGTATIRAHFRRVGGARTFVVR